MIRVAVLTVSDGAAAGSRVDTAGPAAAAWVARHGWVLAEHRVVPDDGDVITSALIEWADRGVADLVLTLGGTGFGPRDVTPEATAPVLERLAPGVSETIRSAGRANTPHAALGRGLAGIRGRTLIVNLPGSEKGTLDGLTVLESIVPHAVRLLGGDTEHDEG